MTRAIRPPVYKTGALGLAAALILSACSNQPAATDPAAAAGYPVTVENCGDEITFDAAPQRLMLLKSASVPALHELGVLDRAVARAGAFPQAYFDDATLAELDDIAQLTSDVDATGHLQISREVVIAQEPDLVFGEVENLSRNSLAQVDINLLEEPAFCSTSPDTKPDFESIYDQLRLYGKVFDKPDEAETYITELQDRVAAAQADVAENENRTAAVLYPTVGGGTTYAYGTGSMAHPQLEAAGFTNVFENTSERVFEVSSEQLLGLDPDIIILLHTDGDPADVENALRDLPGASDLTAVKNDQVMTQLLNFTEPATPLSVTGLEHIVEEFQP
ncbi:ABC transporter substrate-binding protein [Enteractinococcus helveticum]|uniref:ABC transporter substrate-binding protein n=1 Tax=Enteractinococcus helveticum TaxID=1837282 RepID=UPI0005BE2D85|nr:ABC transporter substrate-binding protein [Enteractinococcus helveticum]